jgi:DNA polymerase (family 10)
MALKNLIIDTLGEIADLYEFNGENPFKIKALRNGMSTIGQFEGNIEEKIKDGSIKNEKGIGKGIYSIIEDIVKNGFSLELENLKSNLPKGLFDLFSIHGLGIKKIKILNSELDISSIDDLESACKEKKISLLKGFGAKTEESVLKEIERLHAVKGFMLMHTAENKMTSILSLLKKIPVVKTAEAAGEVIRKCEFVRSLEITALVSDTEDLFSKLKKISAGKLKLLKPISDERLVSSLSYGNVSCIEYSENESGTIQKIFCTSDELQYNHLKCMLSGSAEYNRFVKNVISDDTIPEMREEETVNKTDRLRSNSDIDEASMQGLLHFHTTFSDGINSLREMIVAAGEAGFKYAAVCDHSKSAFYANGLNEEKILLQKEEILKIGKETGFNIYQGIEADILSDGKLDYSDEVLSQFEFVVASVHSRFNLGENEMTERIIRAVECPYTDNLGHPTGRLLFSRDSYKVNINKIIDACAENKVAIEINASPYRLDLNWRNVWYAREKGCHLAINPDAHSVSGIADVKYGIGVARKAGVKKAEVINCFNNEEFLKYINRKVIKYKHK